jgi:hypothetical protein
MKAKDQKFILPHRHIEISSIIFKHNTLHQEFLLLELGLLTMPNYMDWPHNTLDSFPRHLPVELKLQWNPLVIGTFFLLNIEQTKSLFV